MKRNVQIINIVAAGTIEEKMLDQLKFKSAMAAGILDNGEGMVFLGESKFNELMKQVSGLTTETASPQLSTEQDKKEESIKFAPKDGVTETSNTNQLVDDKLKKSEVEFSDKEPVSNGQGRDTSTGNSETEELVQAGASFFGKLLETLSDQSKTEKLVESIVKKDEKTGETYLKIPVKNQELLETGIKMLGQLFGRKG